MKESCHFLALEDNPNEVFFLQRAFGKSSRKATVFICRNIDEAKAYLSGIGVFADRARFPIPHAVLTDLHLPPGNGLDFVAWLRAHPQFSQLPIFVLSGSSNPAEIQDALLRGANRVLMKPDQLPELLALIDQLVGQVCGQIHNPSAATG